MTTCHVVSCVNCYVCLFVCYNDVTDFRPSEMCHCVIKRTSEEERNPLLRNVGKYLTGDTVSYP